MGAQSPDIHISSLSNLSHNSQCRESVAQRRAGVAPQCLFFEQWGQYFSGVDVDYYLLLPHYFGVSFAIYQNSNIVILYPYQCWVEYSTNTHKIGAESDTTLMPVLYVYIRQFCSNLFRYCSETFDNHFMFSKNMLRNVEKNTKVILKYFLYCSIGEFWKLSTFTLLIL